MTELIQGLEKPKPVTTVPNLLRPQQVADNKAVIARIEHSMTQPQHQDKVVATRQLRTLRESLDRFTPREYSSRSIDEAVRTEAELRGKILEGMPTQEEMRRCPPGAVDKHRQWESRNKENIQNWKHVQLRLNAGSENQDVANIEQLRPRGGSGEMSMDSAVVPVQTAYHLPPAGTPQGTVFSDAETAQIAGLDPETANQLALMTNEQRAKVKKTIQNLAKPEVDSMADLRVRAKVAGVTAAFGVKKEDLAVAVAAAEDTE